MIQIRKTTLFTPPSEIIISGKDHQCILKYLVERLLRYSQSANVLTHELVANCKLKNKPSL